MKKVLKIVARLRPPAVYFGFPVDADAGGNAERHAGKRGIALIIAVMIISLMIIFASDMIITSSVDLELAVTSRDNIKAEYLAKSAANLAIFTVTADLAKDLFLASPQSPMKSEPGDAPVKFWNALNPLPPIGGESDQMLSAVTSGLGLSAVLDSGVIEQLKLFEGDMKIDVTDEQTKINVNYCASGAREPCTVVKLMLTSLLSCPAERLFLEKRKLTAASMVAKIQDWVDSDSRAEPDSSLSDENEPYQKKQHQYKAKNAPLDTIDELRMIDGWDDDMHTVFSPYITAYPFWKKREERPKLNLSSASRELLQCLFPDAKGETAQKLVMALKARDNDGDPLFTPGQKMSDVLQSLLGYTPSSNQPNDPNDKSTWFSKISNVYRIKTTGRVGNSEKTIEMVVERTMPEPTKEQKTSYKILYWKLL